MAQIAAPDPRLHATGLTVACIAILTPQLRATGGERHQQWSHLDGFAAGAREDVAWSQPLASNHVLAAGCDDVDLRIVQLIVSALLRTDLPVQFHTASALRIEIFRIRP